MFWTHFKAIFYRNLLIHSDSVPFFFLIMVLLNLVKFYFGVSYEIYFFLSMLIIIYIFQRNLILNFIEDKILKFRSLFTVAGMDNFNYIMAQVFSNFILMLFVICFGYLFTLIQRNFTFSVIELQFLMVSCLFAFSLITFNLFMSLFFKNPLLAADISNMITFVLNLVAMILTLMESPLVNLIRIIPNTPYYIMVKAIVIDTGSTTFLTLLPDMVLLVVLMFAYLLIYYKLDMIMNDDNGMNRGLYEILRELFSGKKKKQRESQLDDSQASEDSLPDMSSPHKSKFPKKKLFGNNSMKRKNSKENLSVISEEPTDNQVFSHYRPILRLEKISKRFDGNHMFRIKRLNMDFRRGEISCLIGANGAGKSTMLNLISGIYRSDSGQIKYFNKRGEEIKTRKNIGFCSSENILFDTLTVEQHFKFFFMLQGIEDYETEMLRLMTIFNIKKYRHYRSSELSGGNKRKLCVAISFIGEPEIILLDEPSSSLDPFSKKEMFKILTNLNLRKKCTIILTSHDFQEIQTFHRDICLIKLGKIICRGNLKRIKRHFGVGCSIKISKKSFMDKPDIINKFKQQLETVERQMKTNSIKRLSMTEIATQGADADTPTDKMNESILKTLSKLDFPPNSHRESIEIRYDAKGDLFIEVPNLISDHLGPIYTVIDDLLGSDIQVDVTNSLEIKKILYQEGEHQAAKELAFESERAFDRKNETIKSEHNVRSNSTIRSQKPKSEARSVVESKSLSHDFETGSQLTATDSELGFDNISNSTYAFSKVNEYLSEKSEQANAKKDLKVLRERILKGMEAKSRSHFLTRISIIVKTRFKFLYANTVELTTAIIVTGITTLCGCYCFVVAENLFPMITLNELIYYCTLAILITEGYNNILYSYHMVYENSYSIKKLLICNGLKIHEYYIGNMIADFIINLPIQAPLFLGLFVTIKFLIIESVVSSYQIFLFCFVLLMWKCSFIVINYFYSFIFIRTNFVTRNFCVLYLTISGICLVLSRYVPILFYFNDFVFCLNILNSFNLIEQRLPEIILVPIFQIAFYFMLIQIYEHHSITHNYLASVKSKNENHSNEQLNLVDRQSSQKAPKLAKRDNLKVRIKNLKKIYGGDTLSLNLSELRLNRKDCIGLIGPNGAGKSTFFNVIISEIKKSGGLIMFGNRPNQVPFYKFTFAVCLQKNSLWVDLTVRDHFEFYCKLIGVRSRVFKRSLIEYFNLEKFMNHKIFQLTDGNMRKVCIALSLLRKPDFILYDEATTGIDIVNCHNIQMLIKDIQKKFGSILILTTHLMREVEFLCKEIGVLYEGEFALHDSIEETKSVFSKRIIKVIVNEERFDEEEFKRELEEICELEKKGESTESRRIYEIVTLNEGKNVLDLMRKVDQLRLAGVLKDYDISKKSLDDIFISLVRKTRIHRRDQVEVASNDFFLESQFNLDESLNKFKLKAKYVNQKLKNVNYVDTMANLPFTRDPSNKHASDVEAEESVKSKREDLSKTLIEDDQP